MLREKLTGEQGITAYGQQSSPAATGTPIFIQGIMPRSGTNFLTRLIALHPDCQHPAPIMEDLLLHRAHLLVRFADQVWKAWHNHKGWDVPALEHKRLLRALGNGLVAFLQEKIEAPRVVTKSPQVYHLEHFFDLFPQAKLIVLVRDGRSVVASGMRSFDWKFEVGVDRWKTAADHVIRFVGGPTDKSCYLCLKYEDLHQDLNAQLPRLLEYLELDSARYDFEAAARLPIVGSSEGRLPDRRQVSWEPVRKTDAFQPLERWRQWPGEQLRHFERLAGEQLLQLGYQLHGGTEQRPLFTQKLWARGARHKPVDSPHKKRRSWWERLGIKRAA
jgi:hypothetical protein